MMLGWIVFWPAQLKNHVNQYRSDNAGIDDGGNGGNDDSDNSDSGNDDDADGPKRQYCRHWEQTRTGKNQWCINRQTSY